MFELEKRNCPICEHNTKNNLIGMLTPNNNPFKDKPLKFPLSCCKECDLVYLSKIPKKDDLYKCYTDNIQFTCEDYTGKRVPLILQFFRDRLNEMTRHAKLDKNNLKTLEIGGGLSWVSRVVKSFNEHNFTVSQDLTKECVDNCTWVDKYLLGDLTEVFEKLQQLGPFHIISMSHVFEHLIFPKDVLNVCRKLLDENGMIFINAPHRPKGWNNSSSFSEWEKWSYNHVPTHINYYNENSLQKLANKTGLKLVFYEATAEEGQAFEVWFSKLPTEIYHESGLRKILKKITR